MDLETLQFRAKTFQRIRDFFIQRGYLELDTPALSPHLIPESCLEVFRTYYLIPALGRPHRSIWFPPRRSTSSPCWPGTR